MVSTESSPSESSSPKLTFLATALVTVAASNGNQRRARILIDQGSEATFITEDLASSLKLTRQASTINIIGIGHTETQSSRGRATILLQSDRPYNPAIEVKAFILNKLTAKIPPFTCKSKAINDFQHLDLADPTYWKAGSIDLILGADHYHQIIKPGLIKSESYQLIAQSTTLGWIISGPTCCDSCYPRTSLSVVKKSSNQQLIELLRSFWEQEELPSISASNLTPDEQECEDHFVKTHYRDASGRYVVRLPFKSNPESLGETKTIAENFLTRLKRRLAKEPAFSELYHAFLKEYEDLGHMVQAAPISPSTKSFYFPHHGVLREDSLTTKLRVVFNGSAKSSSGVSINEIMHAGPKLQMNSSDVLLWFRMHRLVFGTDITKMFRQINVDPADWDYQRILWMDNQQRQREYQLTTVTYGTTCAPWLSLRVMKQLAEDEGHNFPRALLTLAKGRYVDDIFGGADDHEEFEAIIKELITLCMAGGFPLQKWCSNTPSTLSKLQLSSVPSSTSSLWEESSTKVLGIKWNQQADVLQFKAMPIAKSSITKRTILSEIAQIYDPLGLISPVIVKAKIIMQKLWLIKAGWDEDLPEHIQNTWINFRDSLQHLEDIQIPRWLHLSKSSIEIQLHGFADASNDAMGAAIYLRIHGSTQETKTVLVCSKTKVAPLKKLTIPRLELAAAVMVAELASYVKKIIEKPDIETNLWTDSSVALTWIKGHPSRWKDFVQNRVQKIQDIQPTAIWRHINGKDNPADCASRGITPEQLAHHQLWWTGPEWLQQDQPHWPKPAIEISSEVNLEERPSTLQAFPVNLPEEDAFLGRYSSLTRMLKISAWIRRAVRRFKRLPIAESPVITPQEMENERIYWIIYVQYLHFEEEIRILKRGQPLPNNNSLKNLVPILDDQGVLRVGGRLSSANIDYEEQHQAIIPRKSLLSTLIIREAHQKTHHGGTQLTLAQVRQRYWTVGGRAPVRSYILKCIICARWRQIRAKQLMGQLPSERLNASRAFEHTGVDYAGPIQIRQQTGKNVVTSKGYIAVFICMVTSAIHLEVVTDLSTPAFLAAYKRFSSRRGISKTMHSDNGTNFTGASIKLRQFFSRQSQQLKKLASILANHGTEWKFIPPKAPHMGGKWEAAVKSVKYHLRRIIGSSTLTYEELTTLLCQIEAAVNSRPLCPLTDDPEDCEALTPGHFLVGHPLTAVPEPSLLHRDADALNTWQRISRQVQQFWDRWHRECIQRYQSINKWMRPEDNLKAGQLVLIEKEEYPPSKWPLARIIVPHVGRDGKARIMRCRTAEKIVLRPIHKLIPLPLRDEGDALPEEQERAIQQAAEQDSEEDDDQQPGTSAARS